MQIVLLVSGNFEYPHSPTSYHVPQRRLIAADAWRAFFGLPVAFVGQCLGSRVIGRLTISLGALAGGNARAYSEISFGAGKPRSSSRATHTDTVFVETRARAGSSRSPNRICVYAAEEGIELRDGGVTTKSPRARPIPLALLARRARR